MGKIFAGIIVAGMLLMAVSVSGYGQQPIAAAPPAAVQTAPPLTIGAGDLIQVTVYDAPDLSGRFRVDQNGNVQVPLLGNIRVEGLTAAQASQRIQNLYVRAQILKPQAAQTTVFIEEYANQGITVTGQVKTAGVYPAFGVRMLNDVLTAAGGITPLASSRVVIMRHEDPQHPLTVTYNPEALHPIVPEVQVYPGDTVLVPRAGIVYVLGDVNKPGGYVLDGRDSLSAEEAVALAGGQGHAAALKRTQLVRTLSGGRKEMVTIPMNKVFKGKAPDVALKDGDMLYVPTSNGILAAQQAAIAGLSVGTAIAIYKIAYQ